jgi:uncharacterized OB-fold protein
MVGKPSIKCVFPVVKINAYVRNSSDSEWAKIPKTTTIATTTTTTTIKAKGKVVPVL